MFYGIIFQLLYKRAVNYKCASNKILLTSNKDKIKKKQGIINLIYDIIMIYHVKIKLIICIRKC